MSAAPETPLTAAEQRVAGSQVTTMWSSCRAGLAHLCV